MLFTSSEFLFAFLPIVLLVFFAVARGSQRAALMWLSASSLFFYGWWNPRYLVVLVASIAFNYLVGFAMCRARDRGLRTKALLAAGVTVDLLLLGFYKYLFFFATSVGGLLGTSYSVPDLILPLGISFFTFTQIAFLVDVHRGEAVELDFAKYVLFVTYFPHLIAGPIIHHKTMMSQFGKTSIFKAGWNNFVIGLTLLFIGLAKKLILADTFAKFSSPGFLVAAHGHAPSALVAWTAVLSYTFQLYFDFSGYSDMAVGVSRLLGVQLPVNFRSPYKARNVVDFWRRWHITLSQFLRDYLYISLGGNRRGPSRRYINLMLTMMLGGLWHGANWTFLVWGCLHGAYLCINHAWVKICAKSRIGDSVPQAISGFASVTLTFAAVAAAWVFFRADSIGAASLMFQGLFAEPGLDRWFQVFPDTQTVELALLLATAFVVVWCLPNAYDWLSAESDGLMMPSTKTLALGRKYSLALPSGVCFLMFAALCAKFGPSSVSPFLYFQF